MADLKTKPEKSKSVKDFLESIPDAQQKRDSYRIAELMTEVAGEEPILWGSSMIGFGKYHYKYASGHEGDSFITGFSPRKSALTLYLFCQVEQQAGLLKKLGKHKTGKGCLYIKKLDEVDIDVLKEMIQVAVNWVRKTY